MKKVLICAAIAMTAALASGGDASAAAPHWDRQPAYTQAAPVHHYDRGHDYDYGYRGHHRGWHY